MTAKEALYPGETFGQYIPVKRGCYLGTWPKKGYTKTHPRLYNVWSGMKQRCINKNTPHYHNYGGRGIRYCDRWHAFEGFLNDMGESYRPGLTLDRIDVDGPYCKSNCRWIPKSQQSDNKRDTVRITINGITKTILEWSRECGVKPTTIYCRYKNYGFTGEDVISKKSLRVY